MGSVIKYNYVQGDKIGELIFLNRVPAAPKRPTALFRCRCGREFTTRIDSVRSGATVSCGCISRQLTIAGQTKHKPVEYIIPGLKKLPDLRKVDFDRFWAKVAVTNDFRDCWNWTGTGERYGSFRMGRGMYRSNRIAYKLVFGKDPGQLSVAHTCDNPKCCNPAHLFLATHLDNMTDMKDKGRAYNGKIKRIIPSHINKS